jgi:hypothetical protein
MMLHCRSPRIHSASLCPIYSFSDTEMDYIIIIVLFLVTFVPFLPRTPRLHSVIYDC